jgi:hypothetical protein
MRRPGAVAVLSGSAGGSGGWTGSVMASLWFGMEEMARLDDMFSFEQGLFI